MDLGLPEGEMEDPRVEVEGWQPPHRIGPFAVTKPVSYHTRQLHVIRTLLSPWMIVSPDSRTAQLNR